MDDMDPAQASRRSNEQLQAALMRLDDHIVALTQPTMELALAQQKRIAETGLEELAPSALMRQFISSATGPASAQYYAPVPGQLNPNASEPSGNWGGTGPSQPWDENGLDPQRRRQSGAGGIIPSGISPNASSPIGGMNWEQAAQMENEPVRIPITGEWRADAMLKLASQAAGKMAIKQNQNRYASQAGEETAEGKSPVSMAEFQEAQGIAPMGKLAGVLNTAASVATYTSAIHQKILSPMADIGFGASNVGASMGYSQEGGSFGPKTWHGIPNPLAFLGSEAGRQGTGTFINAAEATFGGTGLGFGEANSLREALGQQGWSNQRSGGLLGATVGGEQETLALALEPAMKKGFKNPEVLGEFTSALKLGTGTIGELTEGIENLSKTSKLTHQTIEAEAVKAQEFMAKTVSGGSTMIHGLTAYNEIGKITGMNPIITQSINESNFGKVQALSKGIKPWEIASMSGSMAAMNAYETVKRLEHLAPEKSFEPKMIKNPLTGETEEQSVKSQALSKMVMLDPGVTREQLERMKQIGPSLINVDRGENKASKIGANVVGMQEWNQRTSRAGHESSKDKVEYEHISARVKSLQEEVAKAPEGGFFGGQKKGELQQTLYEEEEKLHNQKSKMESALAQAHKITGLTAGEQGAIGRELSGPEGLYARAKEAGVTKAELSKIEKDKTAQIPGEITKALEKINKVNIEKENAENAKIELTGEALKWFRLKFPSAKSPKEEGNAGGKSTASGATNVSGVPGGGAQQQALEKQALQIQRHEPTGG